MKDTDSPRPKTQHDLIWVVNTFGERILISRKSWEEFNAWCDAIRVGRQKQS